MRLTTLSFLGLQWVQGPAPALLGPREETGRDRAARCWLAQRLATETALGVEEAYVALGTGETEAQIRRRASEDAMNDIVGWTVTDASGQRLLRQGWRWLWHYGDKSLIWVDAADATLELSTLTSVVCYEVEDNARRSAEVVGGVVRPVHAVSIGQRTSGAAS